MNDKTISPTDVQTVAPEADPASVPAPAPAQQKRDPARFRHVDLETPLDRPSGKVTRIWLRKPMGGDLRGLSTSDLIRMETNSVARITPRISDPIISEPEFWTLEGADIASISGEIASFLLTRAQRVEAGLES